MANLSSIITQTVGSSTAGVNLVSAPNSASIWTASTITVGTTTTAAELPLSPSVPTATKFSLAAGAGSAYCDIDVPSALVGTKLGIGWFAKSSSSFTATITISINSYSSSSNRSSNTGAVAITPVVSTVQAAALQFYTSFDTSTNQFLRLTINFTGLAAAWYSIAQFQVGPGQVNQGAAVGDWQSYTPTLVNGPTTSQNVGRWRRVGSNMEVETYQVFTAASAASLFGVLIPSGYTIDTTAIAANGGVAAKGIASWYNAATYQVLQIELYIAGSSNGIRFITNGGNSNLQGNALGNTHQIGTHFFVPIAEWAGNGTLVMGQGAQVEFACTTEAWTATGTTTAYGPAGQAITGPLSGGVTKTITWQYPIQADDVIEVEGSRDRLSWTPMNMMLISGGVIVPGLNLAATAMAGVAFGNTSATQTTVQFGRYIQIAPDEAPVYDWPSSGLYWRVRKSKASSPVGFGLAGNGVSGLISSEYASAEQDLGTISWDGTAPSGSITKKYRWNRVGKLVTFQFRITYTSSGANNTSANFPLPSDVPLPVEFSTVTTNTWLAIGSGGPLPSLGSALYPSNANGNIGLFKATSTYHIYAYSGPLAGIAAGCVIGNISWITA